ncbi:MAG: fructosamine kinase family protein [Selenomonas sp.]|nr:fructosamine kinase family protein [Selenomonas sp.]
MIEPEFHSLLHGDLWSGNVMVDSQGEPMLIDPAVYVGHHETDLAVTHIHLLIYDYQW